MNKRPADLQRTLRGSGFLHGYIFAHCCDKFRFMSNVSTSGSSPRRREFLTVAEELSVLNAPTVALLREQASSQGIPPIQLALQRALVTPTQIEIIEALCRPLEVVPGYEVLGVIGQGGMGVVFRARQISLNRDVAIKIVPLNQLANDVAVKRFEVEAQVVAKLSHPNIVAAYDFGKHEGRLYFVMELVDGDDADHRIRKDGCFDETTAWQIVRQAASGLAHAQQSGVVHRDVKPANILLVRPPAGYPLPPGVPLAKLGDFGLAWLTTAADERTRLTSTNVTLGSPHYMAPEQLTGNTVDWRADIYSLGATAFHLLSGLPPLANVDLTRLMAMKIQGLTESLRVTRPDITPTSANLVDELMAGNPRERPQDYGVLIERIDDLIGQQGISQSRRILASTQLSARVEAPRPDPKAVTQRSIREVDHAAKTMEIPAESLPPQPRRRWGLAVVTLLLVFSAGTAAAFYFFNLPGAPDLQAADEGTELPIEGTDFDTWKRVTGSRWAQARNDDNEMVLQGEGTLIRRFPELVTTAGGFRHYRLELFVELHEARIVEVHVDFPAKEEGPPARSQMDRRIVLRITPQGSQLGVKRTDHEGWSPRSGLVSLRKTKHDKHALRLERHTAGWYAFVDNEIIGFDFSKARVDAHEFRLFAEEGEAWFSDFRISELQPRLVQRLKN